MKKEKRKGRKMGKDGNIDVSGGGGGNLAVIFRSKFKPLRGETGIAKIKIRPSTQRHDRNLHRTICTIRVWRLGTTGVPLFCGSVTDKFITAWIP